MTQAATFDTTATVFHRQTGAVLMALLADRPMAEVDAAVAGRYALRFDAAAELAAAPR